MTNFNCLYNPAAAKNNFARDFFLDKELGFSVIEDGLILPHKDAPPRGLLGALGGIVDATGTYVKSSFVKRSKIGRSYPAAPESIKHSDETVVYFGFYYPIWGHVITDDIRRIWFLESEIFKSEFKDCPVVYIPWFQSYETADKNFKRLLEIFGIDSDKFRPINQPTQFKKIILPDESFRGGFTKEYRELIDRARNFALKNRTPTSSKKIYYFYGRTQFGEERLAEYLKSKGYATILPEKLTLEEQLNLLINTESFASTLGSCSHNSVFLRDGTETIFIPRAANRLTFYQQILDQVNSLCANYADSTFSIFTMRNNTYCFIISEQLKNFFGDKWTGYEEEDFKTFLQYCKACTERGLPVNIEQIEGYGTVFSDFTAQLKQRDDLIKACNMPPCWEEFRPVLTYQTHVHQNGWSAWKDENQISNPLDQRLDLQAIKINFPKHKVYYSVYYDDAEGWSAEVAAPESAGIIGRRKSIFGVRIRLDEAGTKNFDILYRVHTFGGKWTPWAKNGETLYSYGVKLNAIQIKLENKT